MKKKIQEVETKKELKPIQFTNVVENFNLIRYFIIGLTSICITLIVFFFGCVFKT